MAFCSETIPGEPTPIANGIEPGSNRDMQSTKKVALPIDENYHLGPPEQISFSTSTPGIEEKTVSHMDDILSKMESASAQNSYEYISVETTCNSKVAEKASQVDRSETGSEPVVLNIREAENYDSSVIAAMQSGPGNVSTTIAGLREEVRALAVQGGSSGVTMTKRNQPLVVKSPEFSLYSKEKFSSPISSNRRKSEDESTSLFYKLLTSPNIKLKRRFQALANPAAEPRSTLVSTSGQTQATLRNMFACDPHFLALCHGRDEFVQILDSNKAPMHRVDNSWQVIPLRGSTTSKNLKKKFSALQARWSMLRDFKTRPLSSALRCDSTISYNYCQVDPMLLPLRLHCGEPPKRRVTFEQSSDSGADGRPTS